MHASPEVGSFSSSFFFPGGDIDGEVVGSEKVGGQERENQKGGERREKQKEKEKEKTSQKACKNKKNRAGKSKSE